MPLILDAEAPQPPLPQCITSDDGRLTAWVDVDNAGVLLRYRTSDVQVRQVRIVRSAGDARFPVRSGDTALTPGGVGFAYDAEPGLGSAVFYEATPYDRDGKPGAVSRLGLAAAGGLEPGGLPAVWLTSTTDASHTRAVTVKELPELEYSAETDSAVVLGSSTPIVVSGPTATPEFDVTVVSLSQPERDALAQLLALPGYGGDGQPPPVVLLRWEVSAYQRQDVYAAVSKTTESAPAHARSRTRELEVGLTVVDRPDPTGAALRIPGMSYGLLLREWPSYADLAAHGTYLDLLTTDDEDI